MRTWLFVSAITTLIAGAAFAFGVRLTVIETPAARTLRDIVYDGGPAQQIWTGFSATIIAYIGPLMGLLILGCGASCAMYVVFWVALKLLARLAREAAETVVAPIRQAANFGRDLAAGGVDAVKGGLGAVKDGAGRALERGADVAKAGVGGAVAAKEALVNVAGNIGGLWPGVSKQTPDSSPRQLEDLNKL